MAMGRARREERGDVGFCREYGGGMLLIYWQDSERVEGENAGKGCVVCGGEVAGALFVLVDVLQ